MKTFKLVLEYDGSRYSGWQEQTNARTVMGELRRAVEEVLRGPVELMGAGRTDAGVHAAAQVAHLRTASHRIPPPATIIREVNDGLPADMVLLSIEPAPARFHARHDAVSRAYVYQISTRKTAFSKRYVWWVKEELDVEAMRAAAAMIPGMHDFVQFRQKDPSRPDESTKVFVEKAEIELQDDLLVFRIEASHFLYRMVRRLAGTLVQVGLGNVTVEQFQKLIEDRMHPAMPISTWTAPSSGLFLESVRYRD